MMRVSRRGVFSLFAGVGAAVGLPVAVNAAGERKIVMRPLRRPWQTAEYGFSKEELEQSWEEVTSPRLKKIAQSANYSGRFNIVDGRLIDKNGGQAKYVWASKGTPNA